jgi:hypothetical protein
MLTGVLFLTLVALALVTLMWSHKDQSRQLEGRLLHAKKMLKRASQHIYHSTEVRHIWLRHYYVSLALETLDNVTEGMDVHELEVYTGYDIKHMYEVCEASKHKLEEELIQREKPHQEVERHFHDHRYSMKKENDLLL